MGRRASNNPFTGIGYLLRGLGLISQPGLRRYVAVPLLINVTLFTLAIYLGWGQLDELKALVEGWLPSWLAWLGWLLYPIFVVVAVLVVFFGFTIIGNLVASPFNGLLAEAVERRLTGQDLPPGGWARVLKDAAGAVYSELNKLGYYAIRALPLLLLFLVPGLNAIASLIWLAFTAWMLALEYADFPMGNHAIHFPRQRRIMRRRRMLGLGFGGSILGALMVPVLNFVVIPAAVAGATVMWVEQMRHVAEDA